MAEGVLEGVWIPLASFNCGFQVIPNDMGSRKPSPLFVDATAETFRILVARRGT